MTHRERLERIQKEGHMTQKKAFAFFDSLESVETDTLKGVWKGTELPSGHPMDGVLTACGWYGKKFGDGETVYPLLFDKGGRLFAADPGRLPIHFAQKLPRKLVGGLGHFIWLLYRTGKSGARVRTVKYRGKLTAAMFYDEKPIIDIFARVDNDTLLGVTDTKWDHKYGCFFVLERVNKNN